MARWPLFHVAARWGIPSLVNHGLSMLQDRNNDSSSGVVHDGLGQYDDVQFENRDGTTPLEEAASGGHIDIMKLLLDNAIPDMKIREEIVQMAAMDWNFGGAPLELLLEQAGERINVTESVTIATVSNLSCGKDVINILLRWRDDRVQITETVVAAAIYPFCKDQDVELLIRRGSFPS
jgi:ankyrin repeat protein